MPRTNTNNQSSSWQDYRRRRLLSWVILLTYVPGVLVIGYPLMRIFSSNAPFYIVAGIWMVAFIASGLYMELFPCPKCHRAFFRDSWSHDSCARRCVHCKFPKWGKL